MRLVPDLPRSLPAKAVLVVALALGLAACEKPSHENLDKWRSTEKGPDKIKAALENADLDADVRAHAAQNLIGLDRFADVKEILGNQPERARFEIVAKLAPRLWEDARVQNEMDVPTPSQASAKDAMFELRALAGEDTKKKLDEYLVEWLAGGYYEGRAKVGRIGGRMIVRALGPAAGGKLLDAARSIVARPVGADGARAKVGDELLAALALCGDKDAVGFLLDLAQAKEMKDDSLGSRALAALWESFVQPPAGMEPPDARDGLLPHIDRLLALVRDESLPGEELNDAADLLGAIGPPECLQPFLDMITYPHETENYRWMGSQHGIRCAGADAVAPIVEALPENVDYDRGRLERYVWKEALGINAKAKVGEAARALLGSKSWVGRVSGVELLGALGDKSQAAADAKKIRALAGEGRVLKGWWGKQAGVAAGQKKKDPTLGQVASDVATHLEEVAKGAETR